MNLIIDIYFDELEHRYTDSVGNPYTPCTTVIGQYEDKFDKKANDIAIACAKIGQNPNHPKYERYKGKTRYQILDEWKQTSITACEKGNIKHTFFETAIKKSNNYKRFGEQQYIKDKLYTVSSLLESHNFGRVDLDFFDKLGVKERYPQIYDIIQIHVNDNYYLYPEIGTYNTDYLVCGLIDVLMVKTNTRKFKILDWKTNRDDLQYNSGYYTKTNTGGRTNAWINTFEYFKSPLSHLQCSSGNKYTLQLSLYAYLTELWGFTHEENILCHVQNILDKNGFETDEEKVTVHSIKYLKSDIENLLNRFVESNMKHRNSQTKINY